MSNDSLLTGKILKLHGWPDGRIIGIAKDVGKQLADQGMDRETILAQLEAVRANPGSFLADSSYADLAREWIRITQKDESSPDELRDSPLPFPIWGKDQIDPEAIKQMENSM